MKSPVKTPGLMGTWEGRRFGTRAIVVERKAMWLFTGWAIAANTLQLYVFCLIPGNNETNVVKSRMTWSRQFKRMGLLSKQIAVDAPGTPILQLCNMTFPAVIAQQPLNSTNLLDTDLRTASRTEGPIWVSDTAVLPIRMMSASLRLNKDIRVENCSVLIASGIVHFPIHFW